MCGISGIYHPAPTPVDAGRVKDMLMQIQYRGPDESGVYVGPQVGLGSVRLSIIDLASGQQPMCTPEEDLWIVFNGEIFNYLELRDELKGLGYAFLTRSDTEVLLLLYKHFGEACLGKLNGQFSFAIWDVRKKELFLARDRLGIRPLFYSQSDAGFVFASEIKCLFESDLVTPELDVESLHRVFTFWTVPTPGTVFKGIRELSPGHFMKIGPSGTTVRPYWQLAWPIISNGEHRVSEKSLLEEMEALLMDSIRLRLRADVQVAAYLSGGLDSSATTWFIQKTEPGVLNTFSIGFEDKEFDETSYQNEMSAWLGTNHKAVTSRREDVAANFGEVIWHTEVPLLRTGAVPMFQLSGLVRREGIKVVITGEGADEFLGGYNIFKEALIREFWSRQPNSTIRPLLLQKLYPYLAQFQGRSAKMLKFFYGHGLTDVDNPGYSHMIRWNNSKHVKEHLAPDLRQALTEDPVDQFLKTLPSGFSDWDLLSRAQWLESTLFLSGYLLSSQGDRVSMAHSVEGRYPFLDYRLVEFSTRIPADMRIRGLNEKYLLKKLMSERLPERILKRSKQAYRAPVSSSLLSDKAPAFLREQLSGDALRKYGLFNPATVEKLLAKMAGPAQVTENENMAVAGILSTQLLMEMFVSGNSPYRRTRMDVPCRIVYDKTLTQHQP